MKNFKPLSLAAAVAAASVGYVGVASAQVTGPLGIAAETGLGDAAIIPYYTVQAGFSTGLSVINTSSETQVVKIRLRRAADSMDALDFNVVLSPEDVWTGYVQMEESAVGPILGLPEIRFYTNDNSCTIPENNGWLTMPEIYRVGAEEGYIELIGMGAADALQPISRDALHAQSGPTLGIPRDCTRVSDNFRRGVNAQDYYPDYASWDAGSTRTRGVINSTLTAQHRVVNGVVTTSPESSVYTDTGNVLKVSYFIKDDDSGIEFGNDAEHIENFMDGASITNQTVGVFEGDLQGFDYPDLNGGAPASTGGLIANIPAVVPNAGIRGSYEGVRAALGGATLINDWSDNDQGAFTVDTDWVVTTPGQYLMTNLFGYLSSLADETVICGPGTPGVDNWQDDPNLPNYGANCDFRDIPMLATATVYDREERGITVEEDELVVSPQPPGVIQENVLDQEVNVITFGASVLESAKQIAVPKPDGATAGWATLSVTPNAGKTQAICSFTSQPGITADDLEVTCASVVNSAAPLIGFVAWQRNFDANPDANYGRIVRHSRSN